MLTVYGIETVIHCITNDNFFFVATVLTVYGIETTVYVNTVSSCFYLVATVLTVYGIETKGKYGPEIPGALVLQQCLPFTVLKLSFWSLWCCNVCCVATVLTVYGIETWLTGVTKDNNLSLLCCNSAYRLRY